jgi:NADH-quinone oxidoreductase subunit G
VLNTRIRKRWRQGGVKIGLVGAAADLGYAHDYLGAGPQTLGELASGKHAFSKVLAEASHPIVIVGMQALARADGSAVLALAAKIAASASRDKVIAGGGLNILHTAAARVAGLDLGFVPGEGGLGTAAMIEAAGAGQLDTLYLLGADEIDMSALGNAFVVYQGSHGDRGAHRADVILPGAAYTEKSATYANTEGRVQMTEQAVFPPGEAKEDWKILRALSAECGQTLPYDTLSALRAAMYKSAPQLQRLDTVIGESDGSLDTLSNSDVRAGNEPFGTAVQDFYLTNPIARASAVMAEMSALKAQSTKALSAAE